MLYPTSLRLWRKREQIEGMVDLFNDKFRKGQLDDEVAARGRSQKPAHGVLSWRKQGFPGSSAPLKPEAEGQPIESTSLLRGASKTELLLERLPYVVKIDRRKTQFSRTSFSKQLDKVVVFSGLTNILANEEEVEEDEDEVAEEWSTDKPVEQSPQKRRGPGILIKSKGQGDVQKDIEKLVLSDDDIED